MKRNLAIAGASVVCGGLLGFAATAYATTGDASPDPGKASPKPSKQHHKRHGTGLGPGGGKLLHGESVVKGRDGKIVTVDYQRGKVTATSDSSVTVRSSDGTTWTWATGKDTRVWKSGDRDSPLKDIGNGETVLVGGTRDGGTRTADRIGEPPKDLGKLRDGLRKRLKDMPHRMHGGGGGHHTAQGT